VGAGTFEGVKQARKRELDDRVAALLEADPELRSRLPEIEAAVAKHFGPGAEIERRILDEYADDRAGSDELYLRVHNDLSPDENIDRLTEMHRQEEDLLDPVRMRLTIGFLG
jgi:hypothetical protein